MKATKLFWVSLPLINTEYILALFLVLPKAGAFAARLQKSSRFDDVTTQRFANSILFSNPTDEDDEMISIPENEDSSSLPLTEERRANLFQFLLRDLQVDGVPLLGIDADAVETLQAAIWTTMAGLLATAVEVREEQKACLVFESIPVDALKAFVEEFQILQKDERIQNELPELLAFRISMVGNGVGPAITLAVTFDDGKIQIVDNTDAEKNVSKAMRSFVGRIVQGSDDAIGMKNPVYRYCGFNDSCHTLSAFWNCVCELQSKPDLDSILLSFASVFNPSLTDLINRSLFLYRGDDVFELVHYGPTYERSAIEPAEQAAFGHFPPVSWLSSVLKQQPLQVTDADLSHVANFQRRSPVSAVLIKRVELLKDQARRDEMSASSTVELSDGTTVSVFGLPLLAKSVKRLADTGVSQLEASLAEEIAMI